MGGIPKEAVWNKDPLQRHSISGSIRAGRVLLYRLHHQDFALALGNLVQREHSLFWGQVEGAADWGGHRGCDGSALHHTAGPHEVAAGRLLVREGLRAAQASLVPLHQVPDSWAAGTALSREGPGLGWRVGHTRSEL